VNTSLKTKCTVKDTLRRSVTIEKPLHNYIIEARGWLGLQRHIEVDYTTILNVLAKLGVEIFANIFTNPENLTETQKQIISETFEADSNQKIDAINDELWTQKLRANVPEYGSEENDQESPNTDQEEPDNSNSVKGKKKVELPEPE